jgi:predicted HicB family RNase H-like nuclease
MEIYLTDKKFFKKAVEKLIKEEEDPEKKEFLKSLGNISLLKFAEVMQKLEEQIDFEKVAPLAAEIFVKKRFTVRIHPQIWRFLEAEAKKRNLGLEKFIAEFYKKFYFFTPEAKKIDLYYSKKENKGRVTLTTHVTYRLLNAIILYLLTQSDSKRNSA